MGHNPVPPPPPKNPIRGNTEERHLSYCREMYARGHWPLPKLEAAVERVLRGEQP